MNLADTQQLFAYTEWANALILDAAEQLTVEQLTEDRKISMGSILGTLAHMAAAEWIWLERWQGNSPSGANVFADWLAEHGRDLATLRARWSQIAAQRQSWFANLSEADLAQPFFFRLMNGDTDTQTLGNLIQHVVNHATLHRGQVMGMMRQLGIKPPATDFIFYLRR